VTLLVHDARPERYLDLLRERFPRVTVTTHTDYAGLAEAVRATRPRWVLSQKFAGVPYPREALVEAPGLEWIHVLGSGVDHLLPWDPARVTVTNSAGVQADVMAQYVLAGVLAWNFHLPAFLREQGRRRWAPREVLDVRGQTLVVVGLGRIGAAVARHAAALGLRVLGVRRHPAPVPGVERVLPSEALPSALDAADVVVVLLPLTDETRGLFDAALLARMRPGAVLVNLARGGIVDEEALCAALRGGRLRAAVLDVFAREPLPDDSPLWGLDNVILTPHVSSLFRGWERAAAELFCDNLERRERGEALRNVVDPARGY
jgi:phosphoglycerate dehydrogenase-like enzyme